MNAHYQFLVHWTDEDKRNPKAAIARYDTIRKNLTLLFGADVGYQNGGTRTPWFLPGHHRLNPKQKTNSKNRIDISSDPICHYSIGYELKKYSLDELEALIEQVVGILGPDKTALAFSCDTSSFDFFTDEHNALVTYKRNALSTSPTKISKQPQTSRSPTEVKQHSKAKRRTSGGGGLSFVAQREYAATPVNQIVKSCRDKYLFSICALRGRDLSARYQASGDRGAFYEDLNAYLARVNVRLAEPMTAAEVRKTAKSVVNWCMDVFKPKNNNCKAASAYGKARADIRWTGHLSAKKEAERNGCSTKTIYRHRKNGNCHAVRKDADDFLVGNCSFAHQLAMHRQKMKDNFYKTHSDSIASFFAMNATKTHKMPSGIPYHKLSQNK